MAFDKPTRNALAKMVAACRERLTADISDQLQSAFGLYPDGTRLDVARTEADKRATAELRALLDYFLASDASSAKNPQNAYQRLVREIGFTTLNRLAALRLSEERGLVIECVRRGMDSDGFRLFDRVANGALGTRYATYRAFIEGMYDELALELPALFDRHHPHSHIFPGEIALNETLALLNDPDLARREIWKQDETIGWIYQYYNDPTERKKMRDESQAPRNSRELAVRNQFFTPRYVVEFLTDNTLGRIWFEMRGGETALAEVCRYLVKPTLPPAPLLGGEGSRRKKDPRDLKVLDPACGSGHFLLYAFDLLLYIYEEAWADADLPLSVETGTLLREDYADLESLRRAVPELILRHNLHGIDIDPRAAQIAALALWLRAQRAYMDLRLKPDERPVITKTNIVTAEPMPGDPALLDDFLATVEVPFIQKLVKEVFDKMTLAGEAGILLKIEEEIRDSISAAKQAWLKKPKTEQLALWQDEQQSKAEQLVLFEGITDESFWEQAEQRVIDALQDYARHAENGKGTRRRLFAEDAEHGFAFIDLSRKKFDVVLMNPPFGEPTQETLKYQRGKYPNSADNILCAFVSRAYDIATNGLIGAILDRSYVVKESYQEFRKELITTFKKPSLLIDLGWNVLDANVEVCAMTIANEKKKCGFFDLENSTDKEDDLLSLCSEPNKLIWEDIQIFLKMPNCAFAYKMPVSLRKPFSNDEHEVKKQGFYAARGLAGANADHLYRLFWEVTPKEIGLDKKWVVIQKGSPYSPHYYGVDHIVYCDGGEYKQVLSYGSGRITGFDDYGKPGLSFGKRTDFMYAFPMNSGQVFSVEGQSIFLSGEYNFWQALGVINSAPYQELINHLCGQHKLHGYINSAHLDLGSLPDVSHLSKSIYEKLIKIDQANETSVWFVKPFVTQSELRGKSLNVSIENVVLENKAVLDKCSATRMQINTVIGNAIEAKREFLGADTYVDHIKVLFGDEDSFSLQINLLISYVIGVVFGRWDIRLSMLENLGQSIPNPLSITPNCSTGSLLSVIGLPATQGHIVSEFWLQARAEAISLPTIVGTTKKPTVEWQGKTYPATISDEEYPVKIAWDGILVDDPGLDGHTLHPSDIVRRVRDVLEVLWKDNHAEIEAEACEILGVKDLRDYFRKPSGFFADHLKRYSKSRRQAPIYLPLSTPSGSYTLWIYYHRLSDEILFTAVNRYLDPKIEQVERRVNSLQMELGQLNGKSATETRDSLDELREFLTELRQFREELLRIANLPYKPDLNDGVILNAAPFHRLFRLNKWAKDTESAWKKLEAGEYDWAHIAYVLYPDRVRNTCKSDKSIAIAHGLESLYEGKEEVKKKRKKKVKNEEEQDEMGME